MSVYPVEIRKNRLRAQGRGGGTKDYVVITLTSQEDHTLLIKRWGKTGSMGQMSCETHATYATATKEAGNLINSKTKRGYSLVDTTSSKAADEAELKKVLGLGTWSKIDPAHLKFIDPDFDTTGCREHRNAEETVDKFGNKTWEVKQKADHDAIEQRRREAEMAKRERDMELNETWGMF
ncbi:MAG: WGR domain-containing protein [Roseibium sp.]|nr:WGR domain-containing protein [Roseibium sp.]